MRSGRRSTVLRLLEEKKKISNSIKSQQATTLLVLLLQQQTTRNLLRDRTQPNQSAPQLHLRRSIPRTLKLLPPLLPRMQQSPVKRLDSSTNKRNKLAKSTERQSGKHGKRRNEPDPRGRRRVNRSNNTGRVDRRRSMVFLEECRLLPMEKRRRSEVEYCS